MLVDGENGIVAGHGRVLAARKLGMTEVPCIDLAKFGDQHSLRGGYVAGHSLALGLGAERLAPCLSVSG